MVSNFSAGENMHGQFWFYRTVEGKEPARDFLMAVTHAARLLIASAILNVQNGCSVEVAACDLPKTELQQIRTKLPGSSSSRPRIASICFFVGRNGETILLSGRLKPLNGVPSNWDVEYDYKCDYDGDNEMSSEKEFVFDHTGSSFDSFLEEEGILEEVEAAAMERVTAWQQTEVEKTSER